MQGWYWIAQIQTDSPNEIFTDFLRQLPTGPVVFVCLSGFLLTLAMAWFAYFKPRRNRLRAQANAQSASYGASSPRTSSNVAVSDDDMPDLDLLLMNPAGKSSAPTKSAPVLASVQAEASAPMRQGARAFRVKLNSGAVIRAEEQLSILRDPRDGHLVVQIGETAYRSLVGEAEAKDRFMQLMRELNDVINKPDDNPPMVEPELAEIEPIPLDAPGALPSYKLEDNVRATSKGYETTPIPELNIADAIEQYLQFKLRQTGDYVGRQIHIHPAPGGGVRIQVDNRYFEAVGDVDDLDVRLFLQETIQEWQKRQA